MKRTYLIKHTLISCCTVILLLATTSIEAQTKPSSTKYTEKELTNLSVEELALLRNEVLAQKGYVFSKGIYASYFEMQNWYKPAKSNSGIVLNDAENAQVTLIKKVEDHKKAMRTKAINDLKEIKKAVNTNNSNELKRYFNNTEFSEDMLNALKEIFRLCNLNDINFTRKEGLNKVSIDNGDAVYVYYIRFTTTQVILSEGRIEHSEIFGDFSDGYSSYMSEYEYTKWFVFNITEQGLKFDKWDIAG
ncbi:YARHG domain-containing protein [Myroides odoratimimus]|uniref:YARHG domain-containing protein n=1 Tax=Myroides odoratimimus TaxID=76832 RepID=UPI00257792EB|nr:YARHG domain-containing protein [Myroides odoratimimus]MDM1528190.1 YARHG domain-containing protein [Myroides odoratimimus]